MLMNIFMATAKTSHRGASGVTGFRFGRRIIHPKTGLGIEIDLTVGHVEKSHGLVSLAITPERAMVAQS
jgi:hypothetical protein